MIIYQRPVQKKLTSLRLLFVIYAVSCFLAFYIGSNNLGYFIATVFVFSILICIKNFRASEGSIEITTYYFFGFIPVRWKCNKGDSLLIGSDRSTFDGEADIPDTTGDIAYPQAGISILAGCLFPVFVNPKVSTIKYTLQKIEPGGDRKEKVAVFLDKKEYELLVSIAGWQAAQ